MPAEDLTFVGVSEDGHHLLLADSWGRPYQVPLDGALRAAARHDHRPRGEDEPAPGPLSPRDVQSLIRAGASAEEVAALSGWSREKILKYEGPIVAEREFVASLATQVRLRSHGGAGLLSSRVAERLVQRGIDPQLAAWDAWRATGEPWTLQVSFPTDGRLCAARWAFDLQTRAVTPLDDEANWLAGDDPSRPAPFVPLNRPTKVYDVDADGGLSDAHAGHAPQREDREHSRPAGRDDLADIVAGLDPTAPEPNPDLSPERPRTAAHRHETDEDLVRSMRARSSAQRRRGRTTARPAPDAPSQEILPVDPASGPSAPSAPSAPAPSPRADSTVVQPAAEPLEPAPALADAAVADAPFEPQDDRVSDRPTSHDQRGPETLQDAAGVETSVDVPADQLEAAEVPAPSSEAFTPGAPDQLATPEPSGHREPGDDERDHPAVETERPVGELAHPEDAVTEPTPARPEHPRAETPSAQTSHAETPSAQTSHAEPVPPQDQPDEQVEEIDTDDDQPDDDQPAAEQPAAARPGRGRPAPEEPAAEEPEAARTAARTPRPQGGPRQPKAPAKTTQAKRKGRAAVPSWDDIMFGAKRES